MSSTMTTRAATFVDGDPVHHVVRANAGIHPLLPVGACVAAAAVAMVAVKAVTGAGALPVVVIGVVIGAVVGLALTPLGQYRLLAVTDAEVVSLRTAPFTPGRPVGVVGRTPVDAVAVTGAGDFQRVEVAGEQLWVHRRLAEPLTPAAPAEPTEPAPA